MKLLSYLSCFCVVESLVIGALALALDRRAAMNRAVAVSALVYALWAWGMMFAYGSEDPGTAVSYYQFSFLGSVFITPCLVRLYLLFAGVSAPIRRWSTGLSLAYSVVLLAHYTVSGFYYESFRPGPWGNVGVPSPNWFWATFSPYFSSAQVLAALVVLVGTGKRSPSQRLRRQLRVLVPGVVVTFLLYFLAWVAEVLFEVPNVMVLAGIVLVTVNFYLIARYRYLIPDKLLLENHLFQATQESAFLLDVQRRILGANDPAYQRVEARESSLVGRDLGELLGDAVVFEREWALVIRRRTLHRGQFCQMSGRTVVLTLSPRFDRFDDLVGVVVLVGDVPGFDTRAQEAAITGREKQILLLALQNTNFAEIAAALSISTATVKGHLHHLCKKTGSANRVELFGRLTAP